MPALNSVYRGQRLAKTHLKWDVFVTPSIPVDAVLVDSFITLEQARAQADWIASTGKNLTTIYATHGHGDHFFGRALFWNASQQRALSPRPVRFTS